jgi:hypothetical protein
MVPPYIVKTLPAAGTTPPNCGSLGMGYVVGEPQFATPRQGFAFATVRLKDVR